jgi:hypothetical protein
MKLSEHVDKLRLLIDISFRNSLGKMGINSNELVAIENIASEYGDERKRIETIWNVLLAETGNHKDAYLKLLEELTFTLFNRLAALKVMEAHVLHPEIITRRTQHGDRSFAHYAWLEKHPEARNEEAEGLLLFMQEQLQALSGDIPLFSTLHPYHLLPTAIELNSIIIAFNEVETDTQVETDIWKSDDVLGWLYESYNNYKKAEHKESKAKTEYNKVSIQSQVYTPRWVVKFLVDNSLGKLYMEMYPDSDIKNKYKIANAPKTQIRERKPLKEIRLIDPATGSGNFVLYGFDLFYDLYLDQIENYGADFDENQIAKLIIENNLYGIDLDDRAVQLAQLGLYIKAKRKKRSVKINHFNLVSSDFFLPDYEEVKSLFETDGKLDDELEKIVIDLWSDLQQAYKFGSLVRLEEKFSLRLHGLTQQFERAQLQFFTEQTLANYEQFRSNFFSNLQKAVALNTAKQGQTFLNTKTQDAITFLQLLTQKYDVAVANPPYTDSADFGEELKTFINANYTKPYKFNTNLYAAFIKRCYELTNDNGKMALIHPLTFMYIKSFEDVRKFIIDKTHINVFADYGLSNLFGTVMVDPAFYVLEKKLTNDNSLFISLDQYTRTPNEKYKKDFCLEALKDYFENRPNKHNISLPQSKLKIIEGWPFIYWISDGFREKFKEGVVKDYFKVAEGLTTANNDRFLRYNWEIKDKTLVDFPYYAKGGSYNKYYGNVWLRINWETNGTLVKSNPGASVRNERFYFHKGITFSSVGSKGVNYRILNSNTLFDSASRSIFPIDINDIEVCLAYLNSKIALYIASCLNPTVSTTVGDIEKLPYIIPNTFLSNNLKTLICSSLEIKQKNNSFKIIEPDFNKCPLLVFSEISLKNRLLSYLNYENLQLAIVLLNEAIINELIYEVYELSNEDRAQVETKMGLSVGAEGISTETLAMWKSITNEELGITAEIRLLIDNHINELPEVEFDGDRKRELIESFTTLYQSNNDLEEFCIRNKVNPLDICLWFKESKILPQARTSEIALEFLADAIRTLLMKDEDGIIPLVGLPGEPCLLDRLEQHCLSQGFTSAQFMQLDSLLGRPLNEYIENHFFKQLSDHLNLFMYLPKTPFIWHLSSGEHHGFEAYIIIYKWSRDNLYNLKTNYLNKRIEKLEYRQIEIAESTTAQAQSEKEKIRLQLQEIALFTKKVDELIAEGYNPILDDGVGKNIAPLQKKGMLRAEVLKATQLEKYLNADW